VIFCHSLLSDWNHGNAHFLRGIVSELIARECEVGVYEPENSWSLKNLIDGYGREPIARFHGAYPCLQSIRYAPEIFDIDEALHDSDLVLVHEWNEPEAVVRNVARPGDQMLVWGYRPDVYVLSGLPAGTRFLDSQPLTGVMADRHLITSRPTALDIAERNQRELLLQHRPEIVVDGLGSLNPELAVTRYPALKMDEYVVVGRTRLSTIYITKR
jgi:hypothetical protein